MMGFVDDQLKMMRKEAVAVFFTVIYCHLHVGTKEIHENLS